MGTVSLHWKTVTDEMRSLLLGLMQDPMLTDFDLVGGTALALRFGHRISVDLDFFTQDIFDANALGEHLHQAVGLKEIQTATNTLRGYVGDVKLDFIRHDYPCLSPAEQIQGVRLSSVEDLSAMKLNAISNRGSKKDFWDLHRLLEEGTCEEWIACAKEKYTSESVWNIRRSLCYFDDAEIDPPPRDLCGQDWETVKKEIAMAVSI